MIDLSLYKSLSNVQEIVTVPAGLTLAQALPQVDAENAVYLVNGTKAEPSYILQEGDVVAVRCLPAAATALLVTTIVTAVVAVGVGIYAGVQAYKAKKAAEEAQRELEKVKKNSNNPSIDNRPFLRGASNALATGSSQPYVIGRHLFTPYLLSEPFYQIAGENGIDQYIYLILECGFSPQVIEKIGIEDIIIKSFPATTTPQQGAFAIDSGIFAEDGLIEIVQDGSSFKQLANCNYKFLSEHRNDEIPYPSQIADGTKEHLVYSLDPTAQEVEVAIIFPHGLYAMNDNGDKISTSVSIRGYYSLDGGLTWQYWGEKTVSMNNSTQELRYTMKTSFTLDQYKTLKANGQQSIWIRIETNGNKDSKIQNTCYVLYHQTKCFDMRKSSSPAGSLEDNGKAGLVTALVLEQRERNVSTLMALRVKASAINEEKLTKVNIITSGLARTWDGNQWSSTKKPTSNPASWILEVLTSDCHPASRYQDTEIDLESLGEFYQYCQQKGYTFNWIITQNTKKEATLGYITSACHASLYIDIYGRIAVAIDRPKNNAVAVYNAQNIISISHTKELSRPIDGMRIKYINAHNDLFQEDVYLVMREENGLPLELNQDSIIQDLNLTGVTSHDMVVKYARHLMGIQRLRPKVTTIQVGNEGVYLTPYDKVLVQDDSLKNGIGYSSVESVEWSYGRLKTITLAHSFEVDLSKGYGILVNCWTEQGGAPLEISVEASESPCRSFKVVSAIRESDTVIPEKGCLLSIGELDVNGSLARVATPYLIASMKRSGNGIDLELVKYDEAIYDSGAIPPYSSNITEKKGSSGLILPKNDLTMEDINKAIAQLDLDATEEAVKAAQQAADLITTGVRFSTVHHIGDVDMNLQDIIARLDEDTDALASSISVSHDEILLQVTDVEKELRGLLSVQSSAIQAMVQGGGAEGRLSVSLELPAMIDQTLREKLVIASDEATVEAVYGKMANSDYWTIKGNVSNAQIKVLWDRAVQAKLLASQIVLNADQVNIGGTTVFTSNKTNQVINSATSNTLAEAKADATSKATQALANAKEDSTNKRNEMAKQLGYSSYTDMTNKAKAGQTIIDGGYLRTSLIEVEELLAKNITVRGTLQSSNYKAGTSGWKINSNGQAEFEDGIFRGQVNATSGEFNGMLTTNKVKLGIAAFVSWHNTLNTSMCQNVKSVTQVDTGVFLIGLGTPVRVKTFQKTVTEKIPTTTLGLYAEDQTRTVTRNFVRCLVFGLSVSVNDFNHPSLLETTFSIQPIDGDNAGYIPNGKGLHDWPAYGKSLGSVSNGIATVHYVMLLALDNSSDDLRQKSFSMNAMIVFPHMV